MRPITTALAAAVAFGLAGAAAAQAPPAGAPAPAVRVAGVISAIAADGLTIHGADGKDTPMGLAPGVSVVKAQVVDRSAVKPGSFVASANLSQADGVGRSLELRMFEPGAKLGEGNRPMTQAGAQPGQMMTNATVTKADMTPAGLELDVAYAGGTRHLVVPADIPVIASIPVDPASLKPGVAVTVNAARGVDGSLKATRISLDQPK